MTKYQKIFQEMVSENEQAFSEFRKVHDLYKQDQTAWSEKFNEVGREIQDILNRWENKLCSKTENSGNSKYASNLADKFRAEVRSVFPLVDFIGVKVY